MALATFSGPPAVPMTVAPAATANCTIAVETPGAGGVDQHGFAALHPSSGDERVPGGHVGHRHARRLDERHAVGDGVTPIGGRRRPSRRTHPGGSSRSFADSRSTARGRVVQRSHTPHVLTGSTSTAVPTGGAAVAAHRPRGPRRHPATSIPATCGNEKPRTSGASRCNRSSRFSPQARTAISTSPAAGHRLSEVLDGHDLRAAESPLNLCSHAMCVSRPTAIRPARSPCRRRRTSRRRAPRRTASCPPAHPSGHTPAST